MATAAHTISDVKVFFNPNAVKVVLDHEGCAVTFSRAPIPWPRDHFMKTRDSLPEGFAPLHHLGLYAYRAGFLKRFPTLPQAPMEKIESLEQLRALYWGEKIAVAVLDRALPAGVDTAEDLERVRAVYRTQAH
jgi:3-deoxy-manno-octulosonate cytidylyltransferase (CMP-KDO synthetase)